MTIALGKQASIVFTTDRQGRVVPNFLLPLGFGGLLTCFDLRDANWPMPKPLSLGACYYTRKFPILVTFPSFVG